MLLTFLSDYRCISYYFLLHPGGPGLDVWQVLYLQEYDDPLNAFSTLLKEAKELEGEGLWDEVESPKWVEEAQEYLKKISELDRINSIDLSKMDFDVEGAWYYSRQILAHGFWTDFLPPAITALLAKIEIFTESLQESIKYKIFDDHEASRLAEILKKQKHEAEQLAKAQSYFNDETYSSLNSIIENLNPLFNEIV